MNSNWQIPSSERLSYKLVTESNFSTIVDIFKEDKNPFISESYKDFTKITEYFKSSAQLRLSKSNYAGQDWILYHRDDQKYIGIINLYNLSMETFHENDKRCTLGFAINQHHRGQGFGTEAVKALLGFAKKMLLRHLFLAYTNDSNQSSKKLLLNLGFIDVTNDYIYGLDTKYYFLEIK